MMPGSEVSAESVARILSLRIRDVAVRGNFPGGSNTVECVVPGCSEVELPQHTFVCPFLSSEGDLMDNELSYFDIFSDNIKKQWTISQIFFVRFQKRNSFLNGKEPEDPRLLDPCDPGDKATADIS